jgi:hypothetical protein
MVDAVDGTAPYTCYVGVDFGTSRSGFSFSRLYEGHNVNLFEYYPGAAADTSMQGCPRKLASGWLMHVHASVATSAPAWPSHMHTGIRRNSDVP